MRRLSWIILCVVLMQFTSGCRDDAAPPSPGSKLGIEVVPAVTKVDWKTVVPKAPAKAPELTLWLRSSHGVTLKPGTQSIAKWIDESGSGTEFAPENSAAPVLMRRQRLGPVIHFTGRGQELVSNPVQGSQLVSSDEASLILVMLQSAGSTNSDTIGWGTCGNNRFNTHFAVNSSLVFQMGDPGKSSIGPLAPLDWEDHFHVVSVVRKRDSVHLSVDGKILVDARRFGGKLDISGASPIVIGGICGNGQEGDIAEVLVFKHALAPDQEQGIVKHLATAYGIPLK